MKKALISIGISATTGSFPPLRGAVQDAREFHAWGQQQGFDCTLLVDDERKVRAVDAYEEIEKYIDAGTYSQLIIYFSGHGILLAPNCELWLMSGAPANPNEVVNVQGSMQNARGCGLEHAVFISDACRTLPADMRQAALGPGYKLIANREIISPRPELDVYYATLPGYSAHEVSADEAAQRNRGLFTSYLLSALNGNVNEVLEDAKIDDVVVHRIVSGRPLGTWLTDVVPLASERRSASSRQTPEILIESRESRFLARFDANHQPSGVGASSSVQQATSSSVQQATLPFQVDERRPWRLVPSRGGRTSLTPQSSPISTAPTRAQHQSDWPAEAQFARNLAIAGTLEADILVFGGAPKAGFWTQGQFEIERQETAFLIRLNATPGSDIGKAEGSRTLALVFEDESSFVLNAQTGYRTVVHLDGKRIGAVNYLPKDEQLRIHEESSNSDIDFYDLRAEAAMLARQGRLGIDSALIHAYAQRPTFFQSVDPALGALAAYAYARAGRTQEWDEIVGRLRQADVLITFDSELFAAAPMSPDYPSNAPGMPMMTEGWLLLGPREQSLPSPLREARAYLLPSLWATFAGPAWPFIYQHLTGT